MINTSNSYRVNFVGKSKAGKTTFSIRDYEKDKADDKNYADICASNQIELKNGDDVQFEKFTGISLYRKKSGELAVRIFAIVNLAKPKQAQETQNTGHMLNTSPADNPYIEQRNVSEPIIDLTESEEPVFDQGQLLDISSDDLPF